MANKQPIMSKTARDALNGEYQPQGTPRAITPAGIAKHERQSQAFHLARNVLGEEVSERREYVGAEFTSAELARLGSRVQKRLSSESLPSSIAVKINRGVEAIALATAAGERAQARRMVRELAVDLGNAIGGSNTWTAPAAPGAVDPDEMDPAALAERIRGVHKA